MCGGLRRPGRAEVPELRRAVLVQQDVRGLDVPVEALRRRVVEVRQPARHVDGHIQPVVVPSQRVWAGANA